MKNTSNIYLFVPPPTAWIYILLLFIKLFVSLFGRHKNIYIQTCTYIYVHTLKPKEYYFKNNSWNKSSSHIYIYYIYIYALPFFLGGANSDGPLPRVVALITPTATVWRISRTAKRPNGA